MIKTKENAGADERTPSVPQYFSWINNTNEGSTEAQTLVNLDFFRYMKETYGMQIRIYAWDAGNFDGSAEGYGDLKGEKFRGQYPEGYRNVVAAAEKIGIRMGLWGSPDGYGDTPESEKERFDFFVHLCKDYHFAQFKLDGVCGRLRPEKAALFAEMLRECRKYSPDLIVLNHRLDLYEAEPYVTTYLWNGMETYVDVHACNDVTCMHSRAFMFHRGHTENLDRLAEDHGVCISSSNAYFEDDLIYQAFGRSLILAPEMYGNPWFLRDNELPKLARIYNLHRANAPILTEGMLLPPELGCDAVSRGTNEKRYICTGNDTWETKELRLTVDESIGITAPGVYDVNLRHPYEEHLGAFRFGDAVTLPLLPFRAVLIEVSAPALADPVLTGCRYETVKENGDGVPTEVKYVYAPGGEVRLRVKGKETPFETTQAIDAQEPCPVLLGTLDETQADLKEKEALYESAVFFADNDSLEARAMERAGNTSVPEVQRARDAFFGQKTYRLRGCENRALFDGDENTFFDGQSRVYCGGVRLDGGCLRVDIGEETDIDTVTLEVFSGKEETDEVKPQLFPEILEGSANLRHWIKSAPVQMQTLRDETVEAVKLCVHTTYFAQGSRVLLTYPIEGKLRYLRLPAPPDRIYAVRAYKNGKELPLKNARANNLMAPFAPARAARVLSGEITLPACGKGAYLALAVDGKHGKEGVYCGAAVEGDLCGFPKRAPDYPANMWEHLVRATDKNNTFYLTLPAHSEGKKVRLWAVLGSEAEEVSCKVWLCSGHNEETVSDQ